MLVYTINTAVTLARGLRYSFARLVVFAWKFLVPSLIKIGSAVAEMRGVKIWLLVLLWPMAYTAL